MNEILYKIEIIDKASRQIKKIEDSLKSLGNKEVLSKFNKNIDNMNKSLKNTADSMQNIGLKATIGLGVATKRLYDFEKQMNTISAVSGVSQENLGEFRKKAIELGASTQYTTTQVAELGVVFTRAGFSVEKTTNLLQDTLNMATAGGISLEESASLMANSMNAFGLEVSDAKRLTDIFSKGANISNMTIMDFNELVSKTGAVSKISGVELERMVAMFGVLRDNSLEASVSATGLGATMMRLSSRTSEVKKALGLLNINQESFIKLPFEDKLKLLASKNMDLATATQLFGMEHAKTTLTLMGNIDKIDAKYKLIKNSAGASQQAQNSMMQGLVGSWERFVSALDGVVFALGDAGLTGKIEKSLNMLTKLIDKFNNSSPILREWIGNLLLIGSALLGVSIGLRVVMFMGVGLKVLLSGLNVLMAIYTSRIVLLNLVLKGWAVMNGVLSASFVALNIGLAPLILSIMAIVAAIYAVYEVYKFIRNSMKNKEKFENFGEEKKTSNIDDSIAKLKTFGNSLMGKSTGEINVKVEATNNTKAEATIIKQSNLKLGVQN